jgi:1,4-dihydroxy-2-naphthoate octaprenyltransferase
VVPVVVGTAAAHAKHVFGFGTGWVGYAPLTNGGHPMSIHMLRVDPWWCALGALIVAMAIQVGTNYANDYSDGIRGTDDARVGPLRLTASGMASPVAVKRAALLAFGVAGVVGLGLAWATSWWVLLIGAACLLAGWFYTGGPRPYGYAGLGEVFVFVFFGLVATVGTFYVQSLCLDVWQVWVAAGMVGLLATALLLANNLRDIATDRETGKRTLAVRVGRRAGGWSYVACVGGPFVAVVIWGLLAVTGAVHCPWPVALFLPLAAAPLLVALSRSALGDAEGRRLLPVLAATGRLQLVFGALLAVALWATLPSTIVFG